MSTQETEHGNYPESIRRSRLDIYLDLLKVVRSGVKKPTRIMYNVNISWSPLQKYLRSMISTGFIREFESKGDKRTTRHYEITQSGLNVLNYFDRENDFMKLMKATHSK